jgi:hypothetical protein
MERSGVGAERVLRIIGLSGAGAERFLRKKELERSRRDLLIPAPLTPLFFDTLFVKRFAVKGENRAHNSITVVIRKSILVPNQWRSLENELLSFQLVVANRLNCATV